MNRQSQMTLREGSALALALTLMLSVLLGAPLARAQEGGDGENQSSVLELDNAEFRWGINKQSAGPSHGPGINYLAAGDLMSIPDPTGDAWKAKDGKVRIDKRVSAEKVALATWDGANTDQQGRSFTASGATKYSGLEMVFSGGKGTVDPEAGTADIRWSGTASIIYYSGLVRLSLKDPILTVSPSGGKVTATMGGLKSDRDTVSSTGPLTPKSVTIAEWGKDNEALKKQKGFSAFPEYLGVSYTAPAGADPQSTSGEYWGAFPEGFMEVAEDAGAAGFWHSTGTNSANDAKKIPEAITISWNSDEPADAPSSGDSSENGLLGNVIEGTVEDILRAAGTDVSDTAAAWMDEAWKPLQPGAVNEVRTDGGDASAPAANLDSKMVVDEEFATYYGDQYSAETPMTAGTVGATVASAPSSGGGSSGSGGAATPAAANVADQGTLPVAANLPLTEVVYSNTSASSEAGKALPQWQWWVGGVLLALAAGLFYQAVLRKD